MINVAVQPNSRNIDNGLPLIHLAKLDVQEVAALAASPRQRAPVMIETDLSAHHTDQPRAVMEAAAQTRSQRAQIDISGSLEDVAEVRKSDAGDVAKQCYAQLTVEQHLSIAAGREATRRK